jgi:hypothetical protein
MGHVTCKKDIRNVYKQNFGLRTLWEETIWKTKEDQGICCGIILR